MSDEKKETPQDKFPECEVQLKTLFQKMTEIILSSVGTGKDGVNLLVTISKWASMMVASILIMMEKNPEQTEAVVDRYMVTFHRDVMKHLTMIRGLAKASGKEEKRIIVPKDF